MTYFAYAVRQAYLDNLPILCSCRGGEKRKMIETYRARLLLIATASLALLFLISSPKVSFAATNPTPNGYVGGCNMIMAWPGGIGGGAAPGVSLTSFPGDALGSGGGMARAMSVDVFSSGNGNANSQAEVMGGCPPTG
jgi:hypothetical protein